MKLLREPLLHFIVIGTGLFVAYRLLNPEPPDSPDRITVSEGQLEHLTATFSKTWQRPPSPEELKGLLDDFVREEMLARESVKLGLDRDDPIIRRRLEQKMNFILADLGNTIEATEEDLRKFLADHPAKFRQDAVYTGRQVFVSTDQRGVRAREDAVRLLARLRAGPGDRALDEAGDPSVLPPRFEEMTATRLDGMFGTGFAASLDDAPVGEWQGPFSSGFGLHLIHLDARTPGALPDLDAIRASVEREWSHQRRQEIRNDYLDRLLEQYEVVIEGVSPGASGKES